MGTIKAVPRPSSHTAGTVMDKNTVTRTFSIGAISSRAPEDVSTARRHSSAGIRALLWATSSVKSLGSPQGSDFQTSRENLYPNILTPGSIPQFTIPSLSVQSSLRSLDQEDVSESEDSSEGSGADRGSSLRSSSAASVLSSVSSCSGPTTLAPSDRRAERSISDPFSQRSAPHRDASRPCAYADFRHCLDPTSRAALSLPHLAKVTTPYGFITLSQSPQMASEEALRCPAGLWRLGREEDAAERTGGGVRRMSSASLGDRMKASEEPAGDAGAPPGRASQRRCKKRFYEIIRKHFHFSS